MMSLYLPCDLNCPGTCEQMPCEVCDAGQVQLPRDILPFPDDRHPDPDNSPASRQLAALMYDVA